MSQDPAARKAVLCCYEEQHMHANQDHLDANGIGGSVTPNMYGAWQEQPMPQQMPYQQPVPSAPYQQQVPIQQVPVQQVTMNYQQQVQMPPQSQYGIYPPQAVPQWFVPYSYEQTIHPFVQMQTGQGKNPNPKEEAFSLSGTVAGIHMDIPQGVSATDVGNAFMQYLIGRGGITIAIPELNIPYAIYFPSRNTAFTYCMLSDTKIALAGIALTRILIRPKPASRSARLALLYPAVAMARRAGGVLAKSSQGNKSLIDEAERKIDEGSYTELYSKTTYGLYQDGYRTAARPAMLVGLLSPLSVIVLRLGYVIPMPIVMAYVIVAGIKSSKGTAPGTSAMGTTATIAGVMNPILASLVWLVWHWVLSTTP